MSLNHYTAMPGNPYIRNALDQQTGQTVRLVYATLAQAFETRTLILEQREHAATKAMHNRAAFSTPATQRLAALRVELTERTTEPNDE